MLSRPRFASAALLASTAALAAAPGGRPLAPPAPRRPRPAAPSAVATVPGMPPVPDPNNLYSETAAGKLSPAVAGALERVYVPNHRANTVSVIDPATLKVVDTLQGRHRPAARRAVVGPAHAVGHQQCREAAPTAA